MKKIAYLLRDITEFGKFIAFCIERDIRVWRVYWDEREAGKRCYFVDWYNKECLYSDRSYYEHENYEIIEPEFYVDEFGKYKLRWI